MRSPTQLLTGALALLALPLPGLSRAVPVQSDVFHDEASYERKTTGLVLLPRTADASTLGSYTISAPKALNLPKPKPKPDGPSGSAPDSPSSPDASPINLNDPSTPGATGGATPDDAAPIDINGPSSGGSGKPDDTVPINLGGSGSGSGAAPGSSASDQIPKANKCHASGSRLSRRVCTSGAHDGPDDSEPANNPGASNRRNVQNWFDVTDLQNPPPFVARNTLNNRLHNAGAPDVVAGSIKPRYKSIPTVKKDDNLVEGIRVGFRDMFQKLNIERPHEGSEFDWENADEEVPYSLAYSSDGKKMWADASYADEDATPNKPRWDQIAFMQYRDYMGKVNHGDMSALEHVCRTNVKSKSTIATLNTAIQRTGKAPVDGIYTFRRDLANPGSPEAKAFETIARTDNVNSVLWILSDFHNELGDKIITTIHFQLKTVADKPEADMILVIEPAAPGEKQ